MPKTRSTKSLKPGSRAVQWMRKSASALSLVSSLALLGCASPPPASGPPAQVLAPERTLQWQAPLPHQGQVAELTRWWQAQGPEGDAAHTLLVELISAAQAVSPSVSTARANIEQARASRISSGAAAWPQLQGSANISRSHTAPFNGLAAPASTTAELGLQTRWELDVFGAYAVSRDADQQRLVGTQALWHAARVSVVAEVADLYYKLQACEQLAQLAQTDAASRSATAQAVARAAQAGFQAANDAALSQSSAAEGHSNAAQQAALCALDRKALVSLTAWPEAQLQSRLAQAQTNSLSGQPDPTLAPIIGVPAAVLSQRPDVFNAARQVEAAYLDVDRAQANRWPRLSLSGSIGTGRTLSPQPAQGFSTWSLGPLQLNLPVFDGGTVKANIQLAQARYDQAVTQYRSTVRQAVREVEETLVNLDSSAQRQQHALRAAQGYQSALTGMQARLRSGLASLLDVEEIQRRQLAAQTTLVRLQQERRSAWVALYRALGGGWQFDVTGNTGPDPSSNSTP